MDTTTRVQEDLSPRLKTGDAVYVQLVPGARNWAKATIIDIITNRTYKVQTTVGGIY